MHFRHGSRDFEDLLDEWWNAAGMDAFQPREVAYDSEREYRNREVSLVPIVDVEPLERKLSHGVFNDSAESGSARDRVVSVLRGFRDGVRIPPVELDRLDPSDAYRYRLRHGAHRFYCCLAAGFTHVPAIVHEPEEWRRS